MPDHGLTHVALGVTDLDAAVAFYARYAMMEVVHRRPGVVWLSDRTRPFAVVLAEQERVDSPLRPFAHLGTGCESRAEVDRRCEMARREGCLLQGPTDSGPPVGYWAFLGDPDGNTLEVSFGQEVGLSIGDGAVPAGDPDRE
ncbi:MAG: VOC family protein [Planctomycetes bacterium]|nr:VOC family protein [Planctomycetota bacterium]